MITYKTKPTNKVIEDGKVKIKLQLIMIQVKKMKLASSKNIIKSNNKAETNYKDKTTTWTIIVNNNNYPLNNAILRTPLMWWITIKR